jgi:hypothetical protein
MLHDSGVLAVAGVYWKKLMLKTACIALDNDQSGVFISIETYHKL